MKRIALFINETRDLNTYPPVIETAKLLSNDGWNVDIYVPEQLRTEWKYKNVKVIVTSDKTKYHYIKNTVAKVKSTKFRYDWFISYFLEGLVIADLLNRNNKNPTKTIYYSLELFYLDYENKLKTQLPLLNSFIAKPLRTLCRAVERIIPSWITPIHYRLDNLCYLFEIHNGYKNINVNSHPWIKFSIIQDENRAKILKKEFKFVKDIFLVPNSYIGFNAKKSNYAHKKFKIDKKKKIILYTGGIEKGFDLQFIELARKLPSEYILLLQGFSRDNYLSQLVEKYRDLIDEKKLIINSDNLNEDEHTKFVQSAYIGIAWYSNPTKSNPNMYYLGWASGKLSKYLTCGKPVISPNYLFDYKKLIDSNNIGITVSNPINITNAIKKIENSYQLYTKEISFFYQNNLEYSKVFNPVIDALNKKLNQS